MRVSIYLFREEAGDFEDLLRDFPEGARVPERRELSDGVDLDCEIRVMPQEPKPPMWAKHVSPLVEISDLKNANASVVVFFNVSGRFFAVCFGYAHALLKGELLEPEFGLRVTANLADPLKVAAMQVRTLSENSRQQLSPHSDAHSSRATGASRLDEVGKVLLRWEQVPGAACVPDVAAPPSNRSSRRPRPEAVRPQQRPRGPFAFGGGGSRRRWRGRLWGRCSAWPGGRR
ncbi:TIGR04141 family sporadically distributed protein [Streptomyces lichenis]|uniref:TIGR04141 family sporadically distributed protein n=1 Tax=Streptomyces lichenis TaxID=2306967 RepID=UPI003556C55B